MVGVTLRQNRSEPLDQNTRPVDWTAARPVSGTPAWALPAESGKPRPTSPFEPWHLPPKDPDAFRAKLRRIRAERLSPYPEVPGTTTPTKIGTSAPAPNPTPARAPAPVPRPAPVPHPPSAPATHSAPPQDPMSLPDRSTRTATVRRNGTVRRRVTLLLSLAYLLLTSFASGLAWTTYFGAVGPGDEPEPAPPEPDSPPIPPPPSRPSPPPSSPPPAPQSPPAPSTSVRPQRHPHDPGFHVRPDGSAYLMIPLPPRESRTRRLARV